VTFNFTGGDLYVYNGTAWVLGDTYCLCELIPGNYTASEKAPAGWEAAEITGSPAAVMAGYVCGESITITVTNKPTPGCLAIEKEIDESAVIDGTLADLGDALFSVNITGPSYPGGEIVTFNFTGGDLYVYNGTAWVLGDTYCLCDLIPGNYTATEAPVTGWEEAEITGSPALVEAGDECDEGAPTITVINRPTPGCLEITKEIDDSTVIDGTWADLGDALFSVNVTGPSYPGGEIVTFNFTGGDLYVYNGTAWVLGDTYCLCDLIPGNYTATEDPVTGWESANITGSPALVEAGDECDDGAPIITVTNSPTPGCLEVTKVVDLDEYPFASSANATFNITVTGPSYPTGLDLLFEMTNGEVVYVDDTGTASACLCGLIPGNYTVTEDLPVGWNLTGITPPQPVAVDPGTACNDTAVEVMVTNRLLIPHTTMQEMTYDYDSASGNVTINITDCNDGEVPLADAVVYLRANNVTYGFSPMGYSSPYFVGGDTNLNPGDSVGVMDPGECWTWVVTVTINGTTFFEAWGDATDPLGNPVGYDPDTGEGLLSEYQSFQISACWGDETAWAYGLPYDNENWDYADGSNWGWTNGPLPEGSYVWDLYAGAGQNDITKGTVVGNVSVSYGGGCVNVTYMVDDGYYLGETHLWVGNDKLPKVSRGRHGEEYTDAPGQFPYGVDYGFNASDPGTWKTEWSWSGCSFSGTLYVAAHGVVWMEVECEPEPMVSIAQTASEPEATYLWSAPSWWTQWWSWWH
jgi:hypothetical protein